MQNNKSWLIEIKSSQKGLNFNFKEIWKYRDLILLFVKRDFTSKYKQTILGPAWAVIQPLLTTFVFSIVFGNLAKLTTADVEGAVMNVPSFLFYMIGTIFWSYFSSNVTIISNTFITNSAIMGKVYYPRLVSPISSALSDLISYFIQLVLFILLFAVFIVIGIASLCLNWYMLMLPLLILQMVMLSTGIGIIISSLTTKYRDLTMLVGFGLQLWQYISPIPYGLSMIPENLLWFYMLNPVTPIVTTMRYAFFGVGYFNLLYYLISLFITIVLFFVGMAQFNKIEKTFADTV